MEVRILCSMCMTVNTSEDGGVCLWQIQVRMEVCVCWRYK